MLFSKQWLEQYVRIPDTISVQTLVDDLTVKVVEVEGYRNQADALKGIIVGKILSVTKHPKADMLQVCIVDIGTQASLQIVCGGSNVVAGMLVAVGTIGANVRWHGEGELVTLADVTIRGVASAGMICASDEIGLVDQFPKSSEKEILDLTSYGYTVGTPLAKALGYTDTIIDVENKTMTHRPDLWGHYGLAREIASMYATPLLPYPSTPIEHESLHTISVHVDPLSLCSRASFVRLDDVTVTESPMWLQEKLRAVGLRPINLVVDVTQYVMYDIGQPLHAHDAACIEHDTLVIRPATSGETVVALDGKTYTLTEYMTVVADTTQVLAIAGVMGSQKIEVSSKTSSIVLEALSLDAVQIRKTAAALGLRTDASSRFEKHLDQHMTTIALSRAATLIQSCCPTARVTTEMIDHMMSKPTPVTITVPYVLLDTKIGVAIDRSQCVTILTSLGCNVTMNDDAFVVTVPSWRATKDILIPEDVVEEIARMYGYGAIPTTLPMFPITPASVDPLQQLIARIRDVLVYEQHATEIYTYSFVSEDACTRFHEDPSTYIALDHPIAKDKPLLRRHILSNMLECVEANMHRYDRVSLFEIGTVFLQEKKGAYTDTGETDQLPYQPMHVACAYAMKGESTPFFTVSSMISSLFHRLGYAYRLVPVEAPQTYSFCHPGRTAHVMVDQVVVGYVSELHPDVARTFGIDEPVAMCEISLDSLLSAPLVKASYEPVALFPSIERDIAFTVPVNVTHDSVQTYIYASNPMISVVSLFDVYQGEHIAQGQKSMAYHIVYRSKEKTLEAKDVDAIHATLIQTLQQTFGAQLR